VLPLCDEFDELTAFDALLADEKDARVSGPKKPVAGRSCAV